MVWLVAALHGATVLTKAQPRRTGCSTKKQRLRLKPRPSRENCLAETHSFPEQNLIQAEQITHSPKPLRLLNHVLPS